MRKELLLEVGNLNLYCPFIIILGGEHFMKAIDRLLVIRHKSKINKDWKHRDLFQIFSKDELWISAYENIKGDKKPLLSKFAKSPLDIISLKRLKKIREKIVTENFQFKALNEIRILKLEDKKRSLEFSITNDKIVQEVIRIIIRTIYEPYVSKQSLRFGQNFGTHDILEYIELNFCSINWIIKGVDSTINIKQFYKILNKKIKDVKFLNLIYRLIRCGVLQPTKLKWQNFGIAQKSIISSILINIYYSELDKWIQKKVELLNQQYANKQNQKYKKLYCQINKIIGMLKNLDKKLITYKILLKKLKIIKSKISQTNNLFIKPIKIEYIRYKNDWMIGITRNNILARQLNVEVNLFVSIKLKQRINPIKTKIINLWTEKVNFLGYDIYFLQNRKIRLSIRPYNQLPNEINHKLQFDIPLYFILKKMKKRGYIKNLVNGYRSISKANYTILDDIVIIKHFTEVWTGLINYYSGCTNITKLQYLNSFLRESCTMTLIHKHQLKKKKVFVKYPKLVKIVNRSVKTLFSFQKTWQNTHKFIDPFYIYTNGIA